MCADLAAGLVESGRQQVELVVQRWGVATAVEGQQAAQALLCMLQRPAGSQGQRTVTFVDSRRA